MDQRHEIRSTKWYRDQSELLIEKSVDKLLLGSQYKIPPKSPVLISANPWRERRYKKVKLVCKGSENLETIPEETPLQFETKEVITKSKLHEHGKHDQSGRSIQQAPIIHGTCESNPRKTQPLWKTTIPRTRNSKKDKPQQHPKLSYVHPKAPTQSTPLNSQCESNSEGSEENWAKIFGQRAPNRTPDITHMWDWFKH